MDSIALFRPHDFVHSAQQSNVGFRLASLAGSLTYGCDQLNRIGTVS